MAKYSVNGTVVMRAPINVLILGQLKNRPCDALRALFWQTFHAALEPYPMTARGPVSMTTRMKQELPKVRLQR
jgi:hypothetical protein